MKLSPFELLLNCMRVGGAHMVHIPKEEAYKRMKQLTKQDFGFDLERWKQWGREHPELSGMEREPSSEVTRLLSSYLHEDWSVEFPDWRAAVRCYLAETSRESTRKVIEELDTLTSVVQRTSDPDKVLRQLGCYFDPSLENLSVQAWLEMLRNELSTVSGGDPCPGTLDNP